MKITIIGGGISGLTTALALIKLGFHCEVYEKAAQLNEVGAGIWIQPNAIKVLDWLGLGKTVREKGLLVNKVEITDPLLNPFQQTRTNIFEDELANQIVSIHRAKLQKLLYDALPANTMKLGEAFESYKVFDNETEVNFTTKSIRTNLLIGADGIHSKVRQQTFSGTSLRYSGQTCWRGICDKTLPDTLQNNAKESWGRKLRFGFSQVSHDTVYWYAVANSAANEKFEPSAIKVKLTELFKEFHPTIHELINKTSADKIIKSDIYDLNRLDQWYKSNVILVGDAAHATTPNMGQGAGQGIEDAYYLSNLLAKHKDLSQAFTAFEKARRKKVDYIVNNSWRFGQMSHSTIGQLVVRLLMKVTPETVKKKQTKWIYSIPESFE